MLEKGGGYRFVVLGTFTTSITQHIMETQRMKHMCGFHDIHGHARAVPGEMWPSLVLFLRGAAQRGDFPPLQTGSLALQFPEADLSHPDAGGGALILVLAPPGGFLPAFLGGLSRLSFQAPHTLVLTLTHTVTHLFSHTHICSHNYTVVLTQSYAHSHTHTFICSHTHMVTHLFSHMLIFTLTHPFSHSPTHSHTSLHPFSHAHTCSHTLILMLTLILTFTHGCTLVLTHSLALTHCSLLSLLWVLPLPQPPWCSGSCQPGALNLGPLRWGPSFWRSDLFFSSPAESCSSQSLPLPPWRFVSLNLGSI